MSFGNWKSQTLLLVMLLTGCALQKEPVQYVKSCQSTAALKAFQTTVYPVLNQTCVSCHGSVKTPLFASPTLRRAYEQARTVVDFDQIERSRLVRKANDGHCGQACDSRGQDMIASLQSWKAADSEIAKQECGPGASPTPAPAAGESFENPRTVIAVAVPVPANLPVSQGLGTADFTTVTIPVPGVTATMYLEIQRYTERGEVDSGSYRIRRPRLYIPAGASAVYLKDMGISVNDAAKSVFVTYHSIDTSVGASASAATSPLLSALVTDPIPQDKASGDTLILSFGVLQATAAVNCKNPTGFRDLVYAPAAGLALTRNCTGCHTAGHVRAANFTISTGETIEDVCRRVLPRINRAAAEQSPIVRNPATGANGHGTIAGDYSKFIEWIDSER